MRAIIIDDEADCRQTVAYFIKQYCPDINIVGEAASVADSKELILVEKPDILFLDVELEDGNAFDLLSEIRDIHFHLIFITAFDHYAIKAIRHSAIDYLLKPLDPVLFTEAVEKAKRLSLNVGMLSKQIGVLLENRNDFNRIALPTLEGLRFVDVNDIIRLQAESNYTWFYLRNSEKLLVTKTLKEFSEILSDKFFIRVHQSHLINKQYIEKYIKGEGGTVVMSDASEVGVSRRKKEEFLRKMKGRF